ncbi:transmembrane emp24 domain-containing protein 6-like [Denticeps clupeoides]|uniref:GOLD domain-containing protein n=1 Tax=Denticeps clupeoides TaxID=299321 RepID=A0AAY4D3T3_9TELE|nr:transmembrane emp24 domain-containing protein 6-like [Denticeps clupeoides]
MRGPLCFSILTLIVAQKTEPNLGETGSLFLGSNQYGFAINLPGLGFECFWHFAHQTGHFYLTYMVQWVSGVGGDRHLHVSVLSPQGRMMASSNEPMGQFNFQTQETGFYKMCFGNVVNKYARMQVFVDFGVYYEELDEPIEQRGEDEEVLNTTISSIRDTTNRVKTQLVHMWRHYNYARMKHGADYYLLLSNSNYVKWWSAAQSLVILVAGFLQLSVIRRFFRTDTSKPTC